MTTEEDRQELITRREAIQRVSTLLGGAALIGQGALLAACSDGSRPTAEQLAGEGTFTAGDIELLDDIADTILPETSTPGARAAGVGSFIALMVAEAYSDVDRKVFLEGMETLQAEAREMHGAGFAELSPQQRLTLLEKLDVEQHEYRKQRADGAPNHYFRMMKELTLVGFFTSEVGCTQAMRYVESPGRYDPCAPYEKGDVAWARHA